MNTLMLRSELQTLSILYERIEDQLEQEFGLLQREDFFREADAGKASGLLAALCEAEGRLARVAAEWQACRTTSPDPERAAIEQLARELQRRACSLLARARRNEKLLRRLQDSALASLREIRAGAQLLHSFRSQQDNQPCLFDARQ
jgi:hypothetical protein